MSTTNTPSPLESSEKATPPKQNENLQDVMGCSVEDLRKQKENETRRRWRRNNPEKEKASQQKSNKRRKENGYFKAYDKKRYDANAEAIKAHRRAYYHANREKERAYNIEYCRTNRARITEQRAERAKTDIEYAIGERLRRTLIKAVNRRETIKSDSASKLLGCSISYFIRHVESQWEPWMTWKNYGKLWHIDHFVPIIAFELVNPDHQRWCFYFKNLRPLERYQNHLKADTIPNPLPSWLPAHIAERITLRSQQPTHPHS